MGKRSSRRRPPVPEAAASSPGPVAGRGSWRVPLAICALALSIRVAHLWYLRLSPYWSILMGDARAYDQWAQRLVQHGGWLHSEVFYQAPLYPYTLAVLYLLVGRNLALVRVAQAVLGSAACGLLYLAAARWFGRRAGVAAALILACYGPAVFFDSLIQKSVLDALLLCALLWLIAREDGRHVATQACLIGVLVGCLALTRENALVLLPIILGWTMWRQLRWMPSVAAMLLGALVVLMPAAVHNRLAGGVWVLTTSQLGPNLYIGNSDTATGTYVALRRGRGNAAFEQQDATDLASAAVGRTLGPAEVSSFWRARALDWIRTHPGRWLRLTTVKVLLLANRQEAADTEDVGTYAEWSWPLRVCTAVLNFGILAPVGMFGVWLTRHRWRQLWVLYAFGVAYAASLVLFYVLDRYRYPLVPVLAAFAGAAVSEAPTWWRTSGAAERRGVLLGLATLTVVCNWPLALLSADSAQATTHYNLAYTLQQAGRDDDAIGEYRTAARLFPRDAQTHSNLGALLAAKGQRDEAVAEYDEALRLDPDLAEAHNNLGMALAAGGQSADALVQFEKAISLDPRNGEAHYNRGTALAAQGRSADAIVELKEALRLNPANAAAHNNLGILLASAGQLSSAIDEFRSALALEPDFADATRNLQHAVALTSGRR